MNDGSQIERVARQMIDRFGEEAEYVARALAEVSDEVQDELLMPGETWREIVEAIERRLSEAMQQAAPLGFVNQLLTMLPAH
jgi:hypothetical protein